jgi:hypothetical protein
MSYYRNKNIAATYAAVSCSTTEVPDGECTSIT